MAGKEDIWKRNPAAIELAVLIDRIIQKLAQRGYQKDFDSSRWKIMEPLRHGFSSRLLYEDIFDLKTNAHNYLHPDNSDRWLGSHHLHRIAKGLAAIDYHVAAPSEENSSPFTWIAALTDVEKEIDRRISGRNHLPLPDGGLPPAITGFTGRTDLLAALCDQAAQKGTIPLRAVLYGLAGTGKSALAIQFARQHGDEFGRIWWCSGDVGVEYGLARLAISEGLIGADQAEAAVSARAGLDWLARQKTRWLLIFDNVADEQSVKQFLPPQNISLILTSRYPAWRAPFSTHELGTMPEKEAIDLLTTVGSARDVTGARSLAHLLGFLPLALNHAAATCHQMDMEFADYSQKVSALLSVKPESTDYPHSVFATFTIAMDHARTKCDAAERLMEFLAQCADAPVPFDVLEAAIDNPIERFRAQLVLAGTSLISWGKCTNGKPALLVHRLVQSVARSRSEEADTTSRTVKLLIDRIETLFPEEKELFDKDVWGRCEDLLPHILNLAERDDGNFVCSPTGFSLLIDAASYLQLRDPRGRGMDMFKRLIVLAERPDVQDREVAGLMLVNLTHLQRRMGDIRIARDSAERALTILHDECGPESWQAAEAMSALGMVLVASDEMQNAQRLLLSALEILEREFGKSSSQALSVLGGLAITFAARGNMDDAGNLLERSVSICEEIYGPDHLETAQALTQLASHLRLARSETGKSRELLIRALAIFERRLGPEHFLVGNTVEELANLDLSSGNREAASKQFERATQASAEFRGDDAFATVALAADTIRTRSKQNWEEIEAAHKIKAKAASRQFGPDNAVTLSAEYQLACIYIRNYKTEAALPLLRHVCERFLEVREPTDTHLISCCTTLGIAEITAGDIKSAREVLWKIIDPGLAPAGKAACEATKALFYRGEVSWRENDLESAMSEFQRALKIMQLLKAETNALDDSPESVDAIPKGRDVYTRVWRRRQYFFELGVWLSQHHMEGSIAAFSEALMYDPSKLGPKDVDLPALVRAAADDLGGNPNTDAITTLRELMTQAETELGCDHPVVHAMRSVEAIFIYNSGLHERANGQALLAFQAQARLLGIDHSWTNIAHERLDRIVEAQL